MTCCERHALRFYRRTCVPVTLLTGEVTFRLSDIHTFPWNSHPRQEHFDQYRQRFASGTRALIGMDGDRVAFTAWVETRCLRIDELRWTWQLASPDAVVFDVITEEAYRGHGLYPDALRRLSGLLAEEGFRSLWIYAEENNAASLRGIEKAMFEYHGSIRSTTMLGVTWRKGRIEGVNA
ncbi:MAG: hypothetical protein JXA28_03650 [Bacteroidetes bacterium]|nr:hypothetical protein [Bacteroidota bacterium]